MFLCHSLFCSWYLSFSPGLSFCLDWNLHWAIPFSLLPATVTHLSLLIRSKPHQKKKNAHFRFPLLILHISPRNFACHRQVQVTNACPNSVMSDLTSSKFKYKQNRKCTRSLASTAPQAHAPAEKKNITNTNT